MSLVCSNSQFFCFAKVFTKHKSLWYIQAVRKRVFHLKKYLVTKHQGLIHLHIHAFPFDECVNFSAKSQQELFVVLGSFKSTTFKMFD